MAKYTAKERVHGNKTYIFVTRGKSKEFSEEEINQFLGQTPEQEWSLPKDRQRRRMFLNDLKMGLKFCAQKYCTTEELIIAEARRVVPHFNIGATDG